MSDKKGELSINFIIILVLALIVLAVVIYIFSTNVSKGNDDLSGCQSKSGQCARVDEPCPTGYSGTTFFNKGCDDGYKCCLPVLNNDKN